MCRHEREESEKGGGGELHCEIVMMVGTAMCGGVAMNAIVELRGRNRDQLMN